VSSQVVSNGAVALLAEADAALTLAKAAATTATSGPTAQATVSATEMYELNQVLLPTAQFLTDVHFTY
jgi:hypothetical protein